VDVKRVASTLLREVDAWAAPAFRAVFGALDSQRAELEALRARVAALEAKQANIARPGRNE
jgi:BMFP domain-containing protein YqiC